MPVVGLAKVINALLAPLIIPRVAAVAMFIGMILAVIWGRFTQLVLRAVPRVRAPVLLIA